MHKTVRGDNESVNYIGIVKNDYQEDTRFYGDYYYITSGLISDGLSRGKYSDVKEKVNNTEYDLLSKGASYREKSKVGVMTIKNSKLELLNQLKLCWL